MYTLIRAMGKVRGEGARWVEADIGDMTMNAIYQKYSRLFAIVKTHLEGDAEECLDMESIRTATAGLLITFNQYLTANGDQALPTSNTIPEIKVRYARNQDIVRAGYKVKPVNLLASTDAQLPPEDKSSLYLTRDDLDFNILGKHAMISVNGYYHFVEADPTGAWVHEGDLSRRVSGKAYMQIVSFLNIGELEYLKITPDMIYKQSADQLYRHRAFINTGKDLSDKTVILVLGGYMHILDRNTFYRVNDESICINIEAIPLLQRYHESVPYLDLSTLPLDKNTFNETNVSTEQFYSDENILAYLTLPQSFIVLLDNDEVFIERDHLDGSPMPGMWISHVKPEWPVVTGHGRTTEYWKTFEDTKWSITSYDTLRYNRNYRTVYQDQEEVVNDNRTPGDRYRHSLTYFLKIGTSLVA